jgi:hypothetical protein
MKSAKGTSDFQDISVAFAVINTAVNPVHQNHLSSLVVVTGAKEWRVSIQNRL